MNGTAHVIAHKSGSRETVGRRRTHEPTPTFFLSPRQLARLCIHRYALLPHFHVQNVIVHRLLNLLTCMKGLGARPAGEDVFSHVHLAGSPATSP